MTLSALRRQNFALLVVSLAATVLGATGAAARDDLLVTAVYSRVSKDYHRQKLPDGSFKHEYFAIANGGYRPGQMADPSIDSVHFPTIAGAVAEQLARQGYLLAKDSKSADLLLVISWGTTIPFNSGEYRMGVDGLGGAVNQLGAANRVPPGANGVVANPAERQAAKEELEGQLVYMQNFEEVRQHSNEYNARLLGYVDELNYRDNPTRFAGAGTYFDDLVSDIETDRYFVIICAYDFRAAVKDQKQKLLWSTRVSLQARGNQFDKSLATMLARAGRYLGQESGHLVRQEREGVISYGDLEVVRVMPDAKSPAPAEPPRK